MKEFVINVNSLETRIALIEDKRLAELAIERIEERSVVGNIYKGRVDSIVPGIQAAFIDIGLDKNGFLYVSDIAGAEGTGDFDFDDGEAPPKTRSRKAKRQSIETILKKNQYVMVQVEKDMLGTKGVRLTNYVTLAGRYGVLMPTVSTIGISRKIDDEKERERLKNILRGFRKDRGVGIILRTAGIGKTKQQIQNDLRYLDRVWENVKRKMESTKDTGLLYEELGPILRAVRDTFTDDLQKLTVDSKKRT